MCSEMYRRKADEQETLFALRDIKQAHWNKNFLLSSFKIYYETRYTNKLELNVTKFSFWSVLELIHLVVMHQGELMLLYCT